MRGQVANLEAPALEAAFAVRLADTHARQGREADMEEHLRRARALLDRAAAQSPDQAAHAAACAQLVLVEGGARRRRGDLTAAAERYTAAVQQLEAAVGVCGTVQQSAALAKEAKRNQRGRANGSMAAAGVQGSAQPAREACLHWHLHAALARAHVQLARCHALGADWAAAGSSCGAAKSACTTYAPQQAPEQAFPVQMAAVCYQGAVALAAAAAAGRTEASEQGEAEDIVCKGRRKAAHRHGQADPVDLQHAQLALLLKAHVLCPNVPALSRCCLPCHQQLDMLPHWGSIWLLLERLR